MPYLKDLACSFQIISASSQLWNKWWEIAYVYLTTVWNIKWTFLPFHRVRQELNILAQFLKPAWDFQPGLKHDFLLEITNFISRVLTFKRSIIHDQETKSTSTLFEENPHNPGNSFPGSLSLGMRDPGLSLGARQRTIISWVSNFDWPTSTSTSKQSFMTQGLYDNLTAKKSPPSQPRLSEFCSTLCHFHTVFTWAFFFIVALNFERETSQSDVAIQ